MNNNEEANPVGALDYNSTPVPVENLQPASVEDF